MNLISVFFFHLLIFVAAAFAPKEIQIIPKSAKIASAEPCKNSCGNANPNFYKYVGSLSIQQQTSHYFLSQFSATYSTATKDCKAFLGNNATLLHIGTQEELAGVTNFLQGSDELGSSFWMGGKYDVAKDKFIWENGAEIGPWATWDRAHPSTKLPVTRVYAHTHCHTPGGIKFRTQFNTVSSNFVCELQVGDPQEVAVSCYNDNDLVVVVDSSGSIGQDHYKLALEFTARLCVAWRDNPKNRLSVIIFSNRVMSIFSLAQNLTLTEIRTLVYNAPYFAGGTASDLGLYRAVQEFQQHPRSVPKNLVFLTDGVSNNPALTLVAAQAVQAAKIRSFSVGIGPGITQSELLAIAGNNPKHVFNTGEFEGLLKLLQPVSQQACT